MHAAETPWVRLGLANVQLITFAAVAFWYCRRWRQQHNVGPYRQGALLSALIAFEVSIATFICSSVVTTLGALGAFEGSSIADHIFWFGQNLHRLITTACFMIIVSGSLVIGIVANPVAGKRRSRHSGRLDTTASRGQSPPDDE